MLYYFPFAIFSWNMINISHLSLHNSYLCDKHSCLKQSVLSIGLLLAVFSSANVTAAPVLRCQIDQSGTTQIIEAKPVSDPYSVKAIDINGNFLFKPVVVGDAEQIAYVKLYVYYQYTRQPKLLQEVKYLKPTVSSDTSPIALTGMNYVYGGPIERELQYGCAMVEVAG